MGFIHNGNYITPGQQPLYNQLADQAPKGYVPESMPTGQQSPASGSRKSGSRTAGYVYFAIVAMLLGFPTLVAAAFGSPMAFVFGFLLFMFGVVPFLFFIGAKQRRR